MNTLKVSIATPNGEVYSSENIKMVTMETHNGSIGVMANHEPTVTTLKIGVLKVVDVKDKPIYFAVSEGFAELHGKEVSIMVQTAEQGSAIDKARAEKSKARAEERIQSMSSDIDIRRAQLALAKSIARLKVAGLN